MHAAAPAHGRTPQPHSQGADQARLSQCCRKIEILGREIRTAPLDLDCAIPGVPSFLLSNQGCTAVPDPGNYPTEMLQGSVIFKGPYQPGPRDRGYSSEIECYCPARYELVETWDERGGDLPCDGAPFCKVCGGLAALYDACDADVKCAGFVRFSPGNDMFNSEKDAPKPRDLCGYLKAKVRGVDAVLKLKSVDLQGAARKPIPAGDRLPGMDKDATEWTGKTGVRSGWATYIKVPRS